MAETSRRTGFPWTPVVLILVAVLIFWVLPALLGQRHVEIVGSNGSTAKTAAPQ